MKRAQQAISAPFRGSSSPLAPDARVEALYLHLPFCFHKCHYCDFYSVVEQPGHDRQAAFTDALIAELRGWADDLGRLAPLTVFAGGGTPTHLRPELWARLLEAMHGLGLLDRCEEFTVEANPETVTPELMAQLAAGGVNRVSIGAQSFQRESLKALERWHDPDNVPRAVEACRAAGIDNLSLDLIFAIPGQTLGMLDADLSRLIDLGPTHLSTYGLTYEPNTALTARLRVGKVTAIDEDTQRQMYAHVLDRLEAEGFTHYEVSNWALSSPPHDLRCRHNLAYWQNHNWLAFGPSAASHVDGQRWRNTPNLATYLATSPNVATQDHETLRPEDRVGERFMLGLRLSEGLALDWIDAHVPADHRRRREINELVDLGMLEETPTHLRLTRKGLFVADSVVAKLL